MPRLVAFPLSCVVATTDDGFYWGHINIPSLNSPITANGHTTITSPFEPLEFGMTLFTLFSYRIYLVSRCQTAEA